MKLISLIIATVAAIALFMGFTKGKKYEVYIENLDSGDHPLKSFYIAGYYLNDTKLFKCVERLQKH